MVRGISARRRVRRASRHACLPLSLRALQKRPGRSPSPAREKRRRRSAAHRARCPAPSKERTVNGTFASVSPARNSRSVGFCSLLRTSRGLTRLVNGRKRGERAEPRGEACHQRKPLPDRLQCGNRSERREGMAPAVTGVECRSWADHPVMLARTPQHPGTAPAHPSRQAAPGLVTHAADPAVRQDASGFSESAPGW